MSENETPEKQELFVLFLDTNTLLHYPPLREAKWKTVCSAEKIRLVLCMQVINELDEKKSDPILGNRAKKRIKEIHDLLEINGKIDEDTSIEIYDAPLRSGDFPASLSYESKDDRIVHSVLLFQNENIEIPLAVYAEDLGMSLRCKAHKINVITPDSSTRLEDPISQQQKKYQEAITELNAIKNRQPVIELILTEDGIKEPDKTLNRFELTGTYTEHDFESEFEQYIQDNNLHEMNSLEIKQYGLQPNLSSRNNAIQKYNENLRKHFELYKKWLKEKALYERVQTHHFVFQLWLRNSGGEPAKDIDLVIESPDNFIALIVEGSDQEDLLTLDSPPEPPPLPKQLFYDPGVSRYVVQAKQPDFDRIFELDRQLIVENNADGQPEKILYNLHSLKHHETIRCGKITAVVYPEKIRPFQFEYRLSAANLPVPLTGKIPVNLRKTNLNSEDEEQLI